MMSEAKRQRFLKWKDEVDALASSFGVDTKTFLTIIEANWQDTVYGWFESRDFIDEVLYGEG
jgi:hypothetical protein